VVDGPALTFSAPSREFAGFFVSPGLHDVVMIARDETSLVRNDPGEELLERASWKVTVESTPTPLVEGMVRNETVQFTSSLFARLVLEASEDFVSWIPMREVVGRSVEHPSAGSSRVFFRAKALPAF
jgi:hypothetical protein